MAGRNTFQPPKMPTLLSVHIVWKTAENCCCLSECAKQTFQCSNLSYFSELFSSLNLMQHDVMQTAKLPFIHISKLIGIIQNMV
jgi:hypothetical protein